MQNVITIDWLSFTIKDYSVYMIIEILGLDKNDFQYEKGKRGYKHSMIYDNIRICYDDNRPEVWCEMSGNGCRIYEHFGDNEWINLFNTLYSECANFTRIDVAYDDYNGVLPLEKIDKALNEGKYTTTVKNININKSLNGDGYTAYIGSRSSLALHRIYDKAAEQRVKDIIPHWIRWEIQLRDDKANEFVKHICKIPRKIENEYFGIIAKTIIFPHKWYDEFIGNVEKVSLYTRKQLNTNMSKIYEYLSIQCGRSIETYINAFGIDALKQLIKDLPTKKSKRYDNAVEANKEDMKNLWFDVNNINALIGAVDLAVLVGE